MYSTVFRRSMSALLIVPLVLATLFSAHSSQAADKSKTKDNGTTGTPNSSTPSGTSTPTNSTSPSNSPSASNSAPIESQILAYRALQNRAAEIANYLVKLPQFVASPGAPIVVLDAAQMAQVPTYRAFLVQTKSLGAQFCLALDPPQGDNQLLLAIPTATQFSAAATALTGVLTALKETRTVTPSSISIPDEALVAAVGASLVGGSHPFYYPTDYPIGLGETPVAAQASGNVHTECTRNVESDTFAQRLASLQYLRKASGDQTAALAALSDDQRKQQHKQNLYDGLNSLNTAMDALSTALSTADPNTARTGWDGLVRGEKIANLITSGAFVVQLKLQAAGGEATVLDGFFFLTGASYYYSGGTIASLLVFDAKSGAIIASRNFWEMSGDRKRASFAHESDSSNGVLRDCVNKAIAIEDSTQRASSVSKCGL